MTLSEFRRSTHDTTPPAGISPALVALWHDARGNWTAAHDTAQDVESAAGAWIHAYLHRKEGDLSNADYWYRRAGKPPARDTLEAEWERIAAALLAEPA